ALRPLDTATIRIPCQTIVQSSSTTTNSSALGWNQTVPQDMRCESRKSTTPTRLSRRRTWPVSCGIVVTECGLSSTRTTTASLSQLTSPTRS
ncbi:hypothetical protein PFISCL1PPCAC_8399, partial [Pristionchus fissidentatus]